MGGLWRRLPIPFWSMVIGSAALAALPLTSGFYSKDIILLTSWDHDPGGPWIWAVAALAAFITALYSARLIFLVFFGEMKTEPHDHSGPNMWLPLLVLSALAFGGGWFGLSALDGVLPDGGLDGAEHSGLLVLVTAAIPIIGVAIGYLIFGSGKVSLDALKHSGIALSLGRFWFGGWGFDTLYDRLLVQPFTRLAEINKNDVVDLLVRGTAALARLLHQGAAVTQTGRLRWYAASAAFGTVLALLFAVAAL